MIKQDIYLKNGTLFATGYNRIVHGGRGDYVEFERDQIVPKLRSKFGNKPTDDLDVYYWWLVPETDPETKVYFQKKTVKYADYKVGKYYVDPYLLKDFKDLTGKVHHITRAKRHWWSSWVISIDGRSPYDYRIDKDGKFKQVLHKFPGVTIHITKKGEISIKKDDPIPELESFDRCRTCSHLWGCRLLHPLGWEECRAYSDKRFFILFTP